MKIRISRIEISHLLAKRTEDIGVTVYFLTTILTPSFIDDLELSLR